MNKKILIVDDDNDILEILFIILSDTGYQVKILNQGETVLADIEVFQPDLVLMDVMLAGMDGREICRNIKQNTTTSLLPIILISGTHDLAYSLYQPGGPDDFVAKPFDMDNLLNRISRQLAQ